MASTALCLIAVVLLAVALISTTDANVYNPRSIVIPVDEETQREMLDDLLQRKYADRYRDYIESSLAGAKNGIGGANARPELQFANKRGQTFVRFGKRSQTFVRFGK